MQKLLRDGSKKHSDPAKASFPVGGSMWALSRLHQTSLASQGLKSSFIIQATRRPIFHSRFEQKKIVVAQHRPNIRQNPGGEMQKLIRDGAKKHSEPAKASFPVGGSMWALSRSHQTSLAISISNKSRATYYMSRVRGSWQL